MKIVVGLSGGVDSSVAAALLKEQGHQVTGITMQLSGTEKGSNQQRSACFGGDEARDLEEVKDICRKLNIPLEVINTSHEYKDHVLKYFKSEYNSGRTPNPCVLCNAKIKFGAMLSKAKNAGLSFDLFATGHYARVEYSEESKRYILRKAKDLSKDQTYFLTFLSQKQLSEAVFPLGLYAKTEVRQIAKRFDLPTFDKAESQDFYAGDYRELLGKEKEGDILGIDGKILGRHRGIGSYTLGQRKGLCISSADPLYVVKIDAAKNALIVGPKDSLLRSRFCVKTLNWVSIAPPKESIQASVRIRYRHSEKKAEITPIEGGKAEIAFSEPELSITPGQIAAIYDGEVLLGGGIIDRLLPDK